VENCLTVFIIGFNKLPASANITCGSSKNMRNISVIMMVLDHCGVQCASW